VKGRGLAVLAVVLLLLATVAWAYSSSVLGRDWTPIDRPIRLEEGVAVVHPLRLDRRGRMLVEIEVPREVPNAWDILEDGPTAVFGASFALMREGHVVAQGATGDPLEASGADRGYGVGLGAFEAEAGDYELRVQVTKSSASPAILSSDTRLVVSANPMRLYDAALAAVLRPAAVLLAALGALSLLLHATAPRLARPSAS
jgi:hypothetical protein